MRFVRMIASGLVLLAQVPTDDHASAAEPRGWHGTVAVHGALRAMFHEGETDSMVGLESLLPDSNLYAIGALADLSGEVTVIAGRTYLAFPEAENAARTEMILESDADAALLISTVVPEWQSLVIDHPIPYEQLDDEIGRLAVAAGMSVEERLPFLLEGTFEDLQWHVIDGRRLTEGGSSHQDHQSASVRASRDRAPATLIGFYSQRDQGVFTHMGSKTHLHCVLDESLSSGHVDHVSLPTGTTIKFPAGTQNVGMGIHPSESTDESDLVMPGGTIVSTEGDAVATASVVLKRVDSPTTSEYAEFMTVGPMGPWESRMVPSGEFSFQWHSFRRLRVTLGSCERNQWLLIDDIVTGNADTRSVRAEYGLGYFDPVVRDLHAALPQAPRVLGTEPAEAIEWISPTSFAWIMQADTLVIEQEADSLFQVTLRARVR